MAKILSRTRKVGSPTPPPSVASGRARQIVRSRSRGSSSIGHPPSESGSGGLRGQVRQAAGGGIGAGRLAQGRRRVRFHRLPVVGDVAALALVGNILLEIA